MSQAVKCEYGAINHLGHILKQKGCNHLFLVTGNASYPLSGAKIALSDILAPYQVTRFYDFENNVKFADLLKGIALFRQADYELIIAIGGGTVLDMAKLINIFAIQEHSALNYIEGKEILEAKDCPLVAIPTTAGSGSQATHFASIYVNGTKYSVSHPQLLPDIALVDPQFLMNLPNRIAAASGMDAFCQAIESYWCIHSTNESKAKAKKAIELMLSNLPKVIQNPNRESRLAVARGAHLAGEAINITKTTAPHAISYPLTSYFGIPHGHAVGLLLPSILVYNSQVCDEDTLDQRGSEYVIKTIDELVCLLNSRDPEDAKRRLDNLMDEIGLSRSLKALALRTNKDLELVIQNGFNPQRINNNPRRLTKKDLRKILLELSS